MDIYFEVYSTSSYNNNRMIYNPPGILLLWDFGILRPAEDAANPVGSASQLSPGGEVEVTLKWVNPTLDEKYPILSLPSIT
jgi:hypothetical protein